MDANRFPAQAWSASLRRAVTGAVVAASLVGAGAAARACGYEDPSAASFQRGVLNMVYPKALYVQGAVSQAILHGIIATPQAAIPIGKDLFGLGYRRSAELLRQFGDQLKPDGSDNLSISLVLIEPMLWTRYSIKGGTVSASVHVNGPEAGDLVVITAEASMKAMMERRVTFQQAEALGLLRVYGDPAKAARFQALAQQRDGLAEAATVGQ